MSRYAINISDLTYDEVRLMAGLLITPVTPNREIVDCEKGRVDGSAIILECAEKQAKAICQVVQKKKIQNNRVVRCYVEGARGGWSRVKESDLKIEED